MYGLLGRDILWKNTVIDTIGKKVIFFEVPSLGFVEETTRVYVARNCSISGRYQMIMTTVVTGTKQEIMIEKSEILAGVFVGGVPQPY